MGMKGLIGAAAAAFVALGSAAAHAGCMPLSSDVVSLGEKAARFYSDRSLAAAISDERERLSQVGMPVGRITKAIDCKPFPNLIGADEWRCVGQAKVCSK
jgi:hypothetical protein